MSLPKPISYYLLTPKFLFISIPKYTLVLIYHKLLILLFGLWINFRLRLTPFSIPLRRFIFHDWSKLTPLEFLVYADHFFPPHKKSTGNNPHCNNESGFSIAFRHHTERQDHHAEFWWDPEEFRFPADADYRKQMSLSPRTKRMIDVAVCEMVVDWHAAEMSYGGKIPMPNKGTWKWPRMVTDSTGLHPVSNVLLHALLAYLGFEKEFGDESKFEEKINKSLGKWTDDDKKITVENMKKMFRKDAKKFGLYLSKLDLI